MLRIPTPSRFPWTSRPSAGRAVAPSRSQDIRIEGIRKGYGARTVIPDLALTVHAGEFLTLLGPSGCGKTTLIRMIAGFVTPDEGQILLGGRNVVGMSPNRRNAGVVFQSYALFDHMTVRQNIGYGLRVRHLPRKDIAVRVDELLDLVQLTDAANQRPPQLSGGMQQRVALARALAPAPSVVLMDEPLTGLDYKLRKAMQDELKRIQVETGVTTLYVTHDQEEALALSDRIAVLSNGVIEQLGAPEEVYRRPANPFVADFVGTINFLTENAGVPIVESDGQRSVQVGSTTVPVETRFGVGERVTLAIRAENIVVTGPPRDYQLEAEVIGSFFAGASRRLQLKAKGIAHSITALEAAHGDDYLKTGDRCVISWAPEDLLVLKAS